MPSGMSRAEDAQHPEPGSVPPKAGRGDSHRWLQVYRRPRPMGAFLYRVPPSVDESPLRTACTWRNCGIDTPGWVDWIDNIFPDPYYPFCL